MLIPEMASTNAGRRKLAAFTYGARVPETRLGIGTPPRFCTALAAM